MNLIRGPRAIADVMNSISRHERSGETVLRISISPNLERQMLDEAWKFYRDDLVRVGTILEIPVVVNYSLTGNDFIVEAEGGKVRHDA